MSDISADKPGSEMVLVWSWPLLLWTGWLTQWIGLLAPAPATGTCHPHHHHDTPGELEVPEPIESEGECSLFA